MNGWNMESLAYRVRIASRLCRAAVHEMRDFYSHAGDYFDRRIKQMEQKFADAPGNTERRDFIADDLIDLREHKNLAAYFAILMIFSAFERFLQGLYDDSIYLASVRELRDVVQQATRGRVSLENFKEFFKVLEIDLTKDPYDWPKLLRLQKYRDAIAHQGGWVTENNISKLESYGHKVLDKIDISQEYVAEAGDLIDKTTDQFCQDYEQRMRSRRPRADDDAVSS